MSAWINLEPSEKKRWRSRATKFLDKHMPDGWRVHHQDMREELAIKFFELNKK